MLPKHVYVFCHIYGTFMSFFVKCDVINISISQFISISQDSANPDGSVLYMCRISDNISSIKSTDIK